MVAAATADALVHLPGAVKSPPEVGRFWVVERKGFSIILFQVESSSEFPPGQSQRHVMRPQFEGSREEVSEPISGRHDYT